MTSETVYTEIVAERGAKVIPDLLRGNAGNVGEIGALLDIAADEIERLRAAISRLREYAEHTTGCDSWAWPGGMKKPHAKCDCGYDELMKELEESK